MFYLNNWSVFLQRVSQQLLSQHQTWAHLIRNTVVVAAHISADTELHAARAAIPKQNLERKIKDYSISKGNITLEMLYKHL